MVSAQPSPLQRLQLQRFLKPSWLAGAISIGVHGVLFAASPSFPSLGFDSAVAEQLAAENRKVPLVELTAAEQSRLPDFSGSFYNFDAFGDLEPLAPLFDDDLASGTGSGNRPGNSKPLLVPSDRPIPSRSSGLPFGITRLESGPRTSNLPNFPPSLGALPQDRPEVNPSTSPGRNQGTGATPPENADEADPDTPGASALAPLPSPEGAAPTRPDVAVSNPTDTMTLEERLQAYTFDAAQLQPEAAQTRFGEWLQAGQAYAEEFDLAENADVVKAFEEVSMAAVAETAEGDAETQDGSNAGEESGGLLRSPIELTLDHKAGICLTEAPAIGLVGAWVSPEGALLGEPQVIRSTGYPALNDQAVQFVKTLDFASVNAFTGYQFEIVVNYDPENCVDIGRSTPATPNAGVVEGASGADKSPEKGSPLREFANPDPAPASSGEGTSPAETAPSEAAESSETPEN